MVTLIEDRLAEIEKRIEKSSTHYHFVLRRMEVKQKRLRDVHLSRKNSLLLAESFVIGGMVENIIERLFEKVFK